MAEVGKEFGKYQLIAETDDSTLHEREKNFSYRAEYFERLKKCIGHNMPKYYSVSHCPNVFENFFILFKRINFYSTKGI